jgi:hypothetical protein
MVERIAASWDITNRRLFVSKEMVGAVSSPRQQSELSPNQINRSQPIGRMFDAASTQNRRPQHDAAIHRSFEANGSIPLRRGFSPTRYASDIRPMRREDARPMIASVAAWQWCGVSFARRSDA